MSYFQPKTVKKIDPIQQIKNTLISEKNTFSNYVEFYDRCIVLIKKVYDLEELEHEHFVLMDDLAHDLMGYSKFLS